MQISRELDYGVRAIIVLATHEHQILSKRRIATEFCIPVNFLALILPKLVRAGLVESLPGPRGGYRLAKPCNRISMYDVMYAVEGEIAFNHCLDPDEGCELSDRCPASPFWRQFQDSAKAFLSEITFDRMVRGR
jgi:Rrf2 family protein